MSSRPYQNTACRAVAYVLLLMLISAGALGATLEVVTEDSSYSSLQNGKVVGAASDVVERTLALAGVTDYRMALYPWARSYDMARLEANVLIYPILRSPEREALFHWVGELDQVTPMFYKMRERREVVVHSLQDARNYIVGVVRDDARQEYLESRAFKRMVVSATNVDNLRKLVSGQVALLPMPEREAREQCKVLNIAYEDLESVYTLNELPSGLYVALSLSTPVDTVQRITAAFAQLKENGTVARILEQSSVR